MDEVCEYQASPLEVRRNGTFSLLGTITSNGAKNLADELMWEIMLKNQKESGETRMLKKQVLVGIDVGGTKTDIVVVDTKTGHTLKQRKEDTKRSREEHASHIANIIDSVNQEYNISGVGVGFPGKFDDRGCIYEGSAPNMGNGVEFNGVNVSNLYKGALANKSIFPPIIVHNDAVVQHIGLLRGALEAPTGKLLREKTIGYIGIGTGLGGSFAFVNKDGHIKPITDGHVHDMMITLPEKELKIINDYLQKNSKPLIIPKIISGVPKVMAGNICSGIAIENMTGISPIKLETDENERKKYEPIIDIVGMAIATVIANIRSGDFTKAEPTQNWPDTDKALVKDVKQYLIGGGIGQSPNLGNLLIEKCQQSLKNMGFDDVKLMKTQEKTAALAATSIVPKTEVAMISKLL
jgi:hypothetical protein